MSRNLLLKSGRLYAWHSSDAQSYVDSSTPGIVTKTKGSDSSWMTIRVRTKNIIPLLGNRAFYINFPANLVCFPIYFDSSDLSVAAPCDAHTTKDVFIAPQGAVGVELVFKKSDNSAITPADVTNVTVGGVLTDDY